MLLIANFLGNSGIPSPKNRVRDAKRIKIGCQRRHRQQRPLLLLAIH